LCVVEGESEPGIMSISKKVDEENLQQQSTTNAGDQSTISLKQETSEIDEAAESWHEHDTSTNNNNNNSTTNANSDDDDFVSLTRFADCFEMPVRRAQSRLGMGEAVFTKACRRVGIVRWPFRRIQSLQQAIASLRLQREETNSLLILQSVSHKMVLLHREIAFIKRNPETISLAMLSKRANRRKKECYVPHGYAELKGPATNEQIRAISEANRIEARAIRAERKKDARLVSAGEKLPKRSATQKPTARKRSRTTIDRNLSSSSSSSTFQNNTNNDPHNDTYSSNVKTFKTSQTTMQTSSTAMREGSPDGVTQASLAQLVGMRSGTPTPPSPNTSLGSRSAGARSTAGSSTLLSFASTPSQSGPSFSSLLSLAQASSTADERSLTNRDTDDDNTATRQAGARSRRTRRRSPHTDKMSLTSLVEGENHPTSTTTTTTTTATTNIDVGTDEQS